MFVFVQCVSGWDYIEFLTRPDGNPLAFGICVGVKLEISPPPIKKNPSYDDIHQRSGRAAIWGRNPVIVRLP